MSDSKPEVITTLRASVFWKQRHKDQQVCSIIRNGKIDLGDDDEIILSNIIRHSTSETSPDIAIRYVNTDERKEEIVRIEFNESADRSTFMESLKLMCGGFNPKLKEARVAYQLSSYHDMCVQTSDEIIVQKSAQFDSLDYAGKHPDLLAFYSQTEVWWSHIVTTSSTVPGTQSIQVDFILCKDALLLIPEKQKDEIPLCELATYVLLSDIESVMWDPDGRTALLNWTDSDAESIIITTSTALSRYELHSTVFKLYWELCGTVLHSMVGECTVENTIDTTNASIQKTPTGTPKPTTVWLRKTDIIGPAGLIGPRSGTSGVSSSLLSPSITLMSTQSEVATIPISIATRLQGDIERKKRYNVSAADHIQNLRQKLKKSMEQISLMKADADQWSAASEGAKRIFELSRRLEERQLIKYEACVRQEAMSKEEIRRSKIKQKMILDFTQIQLRMKSEIISLMKQRHEAALQNEPTERQLELETALAPSGVIPGVLIPRDEILPGNNRNDRKSIIRNEKQTTSSGRRRASPSPSQSSPSLYRSEGGSKNSLNCVPPPVIGPLKTLQEQRAGRVLSGGSGIPKKLTRPHSDVRPTPSKGAEVQTAVQQHSAKKNLPQQPSLSHREMNSRNMRSVVQKGKFSNPLLSSDYRSTSAARTYTPRGVPPKVNTNYGTQMHSPGQGSQVSGATSPAQLSPPRTMKYLMM